MFTRVLGGIKGKWERPAVSRGSLDPVISVSVEHLFYIAKSESLKISIFSFPSHKLKSKSSCRAAGRRGCLSALCAKKKKRCTFIPEPDF